MAKISAKLSAIWPTLCGPALARWLTASILSCACLVANVGLGAEEQLPPARIVTTSREITVASDGSSTLRTHSETKVLRQEAIPVLGQQRLAYTEGFQTLTVIEAYTLKADGRRIAVASDGILERQSASQSSVFTGEREKVILYPNVETGDSLVYTAIVDSKPQMADFFTYDAVLPDSLPVDRLHISVTVPAAMPMRTDARGVQITRQAGSGTTTYQVDFSNPHPDAVVRAVSSYDMAPRFSISNVPSFEVLSRTYSAAVKSELTVTPAIQAEADEITAGVEDRHEQIKLIYGWVAQHIRYLAIALGQGALLPHMPDQVLQNGYGDCKDHAALFLVLLRAKGIDSDLVAINSGDAYTISKAPTFGSFNHMINWVPDLNEYADTTAGRFVPLGELPAAEYGKSVLLLRNAKPALQQIPVPGMETSEIRYHQHMIMDEAGHITSQSDLTGSGRSSIPLRELGAALRGGNEARFSQMLLLHSRTPNALGALSAPPQEETQPDNYEITGHYSTSDILLNPASGDVFEFRDSLLTTDPFGATFFGAASNRNLSKANPAPCFNGHVIDDESLTYPRSRHLATLPANSKISTTHLDYISRWSDDGNTVAVHRELVTHFEKILCDEGAHRELMNLQEQIAKDRAATIALPQQAH